MPESADCAETSSAGRKKWPSPASFNSAEKQKARQEEAARRAADVEHRRSINQRIIGDLMVETSLDPAQAMVVAKAIIAGKIGNVSVSY